MSVNLRYLEILYGVIGAREKFEDMAVQLIRTEHPSADRVRVFRGDGGIDAHDGGLTDPVGVDVFQIKYFPERIQESQKDQIRASFKRVRENPSCTTRSWTLCLPIDMSVEEKKWFDDWKAKQSDFGIEIRPVWGATKIEGLLMRQENRGIRESFFQQENPQRLREMSGSLQQILDEIVGRIPKPERIVLEARLEAVHMKAVETDGQTAAWVILRARFQVTNKSGKAARVWNVKLELIPSSEAIADRFRQYPNANSGEVILPSETGLKNVEFGFRVLMNERLPFPFAFRGLMTSVIRFYTVSEDFIGEPQSQAIAEVAETEMLYPSIENALRNKLSWR